MAPYVREFAQRFNTSIMVLHAFDLAPGYILAPRFETTCETRDTPIPYTPVFQALRKEQKQRLQEFARTQFAGLGYLVRMEDGDPAAVIDWAAGHGNADLIMMPTRGLGKFRRLLMGSVTAKVLHDVACPVFTSAHEPGTAAVPGTGYRSIMCAVELNREADAIIQAAGFFAQAYEARLCLVHTQFEPSHHQEGQISVESLRQKCLEASQAGGGKAVADAKVCLLDAGVPEGIRRLAIEEKADLVVVGRGLERGNLSRMWSQLYAIIRESPCPVLSVCALE